jgi:shikimate dehydrogenase
MRYGLIGGRLSHSHSPAIHKLLGGYDYALYELAPDQLETFLRQGDIGGLNVTIPYKRAVLPYCDTLDPVAERTGSVNTLVFRGGHIAGYNTDYDGFLYLAKSAGVEFCGKKVVVLGSGARLLPYAPPYGTRGAKEIVVISRGGADNYDTLHRHADADVLVNTTPVGMYPDIEASPVSLAAFPRLCGVLDVVYNPLRTRLVLEAMERGIPSVGGLAMLVAQAHAAAQRFLNTEIPVSRVKEILCALELQLTNIVLVGMPGCGKTRVGRALSELTGRPFVDTDELVEREWGARIADMIECDGEAAFREREHTAVLSAAKQGGRIIATGGGAPLFARNRTALKQNGRMFYLRRDLSQLAVAAGRFRRISPCCLNSGTRVSRVCAGGKLKTTVPRRSGGCGLARVFRRAVNPVLPHSKMVIISPCHHRRQGDQSIDKPL